MAELVVQSLCVDAGSKRLVNHVSMEARGGELIAIVGENGAGKSSLMRAMAGFARPTAGVVTVGGHDVMAMTSRERARSIGWLPQAVPLAWPVKVRDAVAIGRFAHGGLPGRLSLADAAAVERVLLACELADLAERSMAHLSGGELGRVHLARTMVGETDILIADEPVAALDPRHRLSIMQLLRIHADAGKAVVIVLHDLALAGRFSDRIIGMKDGRILVEGPAAEVISPAWIQTLFGVEAEIDSARGWPSPVILG